MLFFDVFSNVMIDDCTTSVSKCHRATMQEKTVGTVFVSVRAWKCTYIIRPLRVQSILHL
jgi:hypothetical protein